MKKVSIFLVILAFIFVVSGCKQRQAPSSELKTPAPEIVETVIPVVKVRPLEGIYKGVSSAGGCEFTFEVKVASGAISGTGTGKGKDISCSLILSGKTNDQDKVSGQTSGTYTAVLQGTTINWYLSGPFIWTINQESGDNLIIDLKGISNTCPSKIPCTNEGDHITATLKQEGI